MNKRLKEGKRHLSFEETESRRFKSETNVDSLPKEILLIILGELRAYKFWPNIFFVCRKWRYSAMDMYIRLVQFEGFANIKNRQRFLPVEILEWLELESLKNDGYNRYLMFLDGKKRDGSPYVLDIFGIYAVKKYVINK
eukprot:TRINITY_DN276_c0_g1_i4.p1 TRINITY_DN276_c0_g1~~TRINITY_DN276_c0_g1_i4.p1  ORF type:complete len:139 (-),score=11.62 TRINITY_DN276_c0_g1_i4:112-528(-)